MNFIYTRIAGFNIKVSFEENNVYDSSLNYLRNRTEIDLIVYLRDFVVFKNLKNIDFEIQFVNRLEEETIRINETNKEYTPIFQNISKRKILTYCQISLYQFQTVLKNVLYTLLENDSGFAIHSSAVKVGKGAYLFLGQSGAGKSTIAELLSKKYQALSDDIVIVRKIKARYYIFQTPFIEKALWIKKSRASYEVSKVFFIKKSKKFVIKKTDDRDLIAKTVLSQALTSQNPKGKVYKEALNFVKRFNNYHNLYFAKDQAKTIELVESSINEKN